MNYREINAKTIDSWVKAGWEWGKPISHKEFEEAKNGNWNVLLTPSKFVPHEWFGELKGKNVLGLASGGGFQFSHTLEEQLGGQLKAGFRLTDLFEDTGTEGNLHDRNIPTFIATRAVKE